MFVFFCVISCILVNANNLHKQIIQRVLVMLHPAQSTFVTSCEHCRCCWGFFVCFFFGFFSYVSRSDVRTTE